MNQLARNKATDARLMGALVAFLLAARMFTGALWILTPESVTGKIAALSMYPTAMAYLWMALSVCVVPFMISQVFNCWHQYVGPITYITIRVIIAGGCMWGYLAFQTRNLDYKYVTEIFILDTLTCIAMAAVLANSRNNQHALSEEAAK